MIDHITQQEWEEMIADDTDAVILDVRTQEEVEDGHIPNMTHIDIRKGQEFLDEIKKLDTSKNYYVYCRSGARSAQACELMNQMGFETTYNLIGGFMEWDGETKE